MNQHDLIKKYVERFEKLRFLLSDEFAERVSFIIQEMKRGVPVSRALRKVRDPNSIVAFFSTRVSTQELREALILYRKGVRPSKISEALGVPLWIAERLYAMTGYSKRQRKSPPGACKKVAELLRQGMHPAEIIQTTDIPLSTLRSCILSGRGCRVRDTFRKIVETILTIGDVGLTDDPCWNYVYLTHTDDLEIVKKLRENCVYKIPPSDYPTVARVLDSTNVALKIRVRQSMTGPVRVKRREAGVYYVLLDVACTEKVVEWFFSRVRKKHFTGPDYYSLRKYLREVGLPEEIINRIIARVRTLSLSQRRARSKL